MVRMLTLGAPSAELHSARERNDVLLLLVASIAPARADVPDIIRTKSVQRTAGLAGSRKVRLNGCIHGFRGGSVTFVLGVRAVHLLHLLI